MMTYIAHRIQFKGSQGLLLFSEKPNDYCSSLIFYPVKVTFVVSEVRLKLSSKFEISSSCVPSSAVRGQQISIRCAAGRLSHSSLHNRLLVQQLETPFRHIVGDSPLKGCWLVFPIVILPGPCHPPLAEDL